MLRFRTAALAVTLLLSAILHAPGGAAQYSFQQQSSPLRGQGVPSRNVSENIYISVFLDRLLGLDELDYRFDAVLYTYVTWVDADGVAQWFFNNVATNCADASRSDFDGQWCSSFRSQCAQLRNATGAARDAVRERGRAFLGAELDLPCRTWKADGTPARTTCQRYCSNQYNVQDCCDGIFIPDITLANLYSLSQDFTISSQLMPQYDNSEAHFGAWMWTVQLHGIFFLRMNFRKFPWDKQQLLIQMKYDHDTTRLNTTSTLVPSSSGVLTLRPQNGGDDSSGWHVDSVRMEPYVVPPTALVRGRIVPPAEGDPVPLFQTSVVNGEPTVTGIQPVFKSRLNPGNSLLVIIEVSRYSSFFVVNMIAPIILTTLLGFFAFLLSAQEMEKRLVLLVTLFLALTALQFVVSTNLPDSSYVLKTQALVLTGYALFMAMALESWLVYFLGTSHHRHQQLQAWRLAYKRYVKGEIGADDMQQATADLGDEPPECKGLNGSQQQASQLATASWAASNGAHPPDVEETAAPLGLAHPEGLQRSSAAAADAAPRPSLQRQPTLLERMPGRSLVHAATLRLKPVKHDAGYAEWLSGRVDRVSLVVLLLAYVAILIALLVS